MPSIYLSHKDLEILEGMAGHAGEWLANECQNYEDIDVLEYRQDDLMNKIRSRFNRSKEVEARSRKNRKSGGLVKKLCKPSRLIKRHRDKHGIAIDD